MKKRIICTVLAIAVAILLVRGVSRLCGLDGPTEPSVPPVTSSEPGQSTAVVTTATVTTATVTKTTAKTTEKTTALRTSGTTRPATTARRTTAPRVLSDKTAFTISGVPLIAQRPAYPTGCESISAVMALQYAGYPVSPNTFIDSYIDKGSLRTENGKTVGPSPFDLFIGSPYTENSFGCMAPVIERALIKATGNASAVENLTGTDLPTLCRGYVAHGQPVIVWVTIGMLDLVNSGGWYLEDTGEWYQWPGNEHCMVLIGYDEKQYYFNDPYGNRIAHYNKSLVENRFAKLGKQALIVRPAG